MIRRLVISVTILGVLIIIQATSCNEGQMTMDPPITDTTTCPDTVEALPLKTNKGLNTFGAVVNGKVWVARIGEYFGTPPEEFVGNKIKYGEIGNNPNNPIFKVRQYRHFSNSCDTASSFIHFAINNVKLDEKLPIRNSWVYNNSYNCRDFDKLPWKEHYVIVDYLDTINQIIAGRFAFTAVNHCPTPDTVVVTDGRFDVVYEDFD